MGQEKPYKADKFFGTPCSCCVAQTWSILVGFSDIFPTKLAIIANLHLSIHPHLVLLGTGQAGVTLRTFCDRSHLRTERNFGAIFINYLLKIIQIVFAISFNCSCPRNATSLIGFALGWQKFKSKLIKDA